MKLQKSYLKDNGKFNKQQKKKTLYDKTQYLLNCWKVSRQIWMTNPQIIGITNI